MAPFAICREGTKVLKETEDVCPLDFRDDGSFVCRRSKGDRLLLANVGRQGHKDRDSLPGMCGVE